MLLGLSWLSFRDIMGDLRMLYGVKRHGKEVSGVVVQKSIEHHQTMHGQREERVVVYEYISASGQHWTGRQVIKSSILWERLAEHQSIQIRYASNQPTLSAVVGNPLYTTIESVNLVLLIGAFVVLPPLAFLLWFCSVPVQNQMMFFRRTCRRYGNHVRTIIRRMLWSLKRPRQ
jgi:hypothetical protein